MSDETDDPDVAADRLEAALERIAAAARRRGAGSDSGVSAVTAVPGDGAEEVPEPVPEAVISGLDSLIERLRANLAGRPEEAAAQAAPREGE